MIEERCLSCGHLRTVHSGPDAHGCDANMCACPGYVPASRSPAPQTQRDALWNAIYAAEFVRRVADAARRDEMTDEMMAREGEEAKSLADWHHEAVPKAKR